MAESRRQSEIRRGDVRGRGERFRPRDPFRLVPGSDEGLVSDPNAGEPLVFAEPPVDYEPLVIPDLDPEPEDEVVYVLDEEGRPKFVRGDPEEEVVYLEEEVGAEEEEPEAPARVRFPEAAAEAVRRRAWQEYAAALEARERAAAALRGARPCRPGLRSWVELAGALGLAAGAGLLFFPHDPGFRGFEFNPFLLPILFFALRFGAAHGAVAGLASAAWVALIGGRFGVEDGSLILPGFLAAAGVFAGFLSREQGRRLARFQARARALERERRRAVRALAAQDAVLRELRSRIEEYGVAPETLYRLCRAMSGERPEDLYGAVLEILARDVGATRAAVYEVAAGGTLELRASRDARPASAPFPPSLPAGEGLPGRALREGRVACRFEPGAASPGPALLCGPIREGSRVRALAVVEELPLFEFAPATVTRLEALLEWASEALTRAARRREREEPALFDMELGAYTPEYLADALAREEGRAARYGTPFSVLLVRLLGAERMTPARRRAARQAVCRALAAHTREADSVCATAAEDTVAVILPMHEGLDVISLADRVNTAVARTWSRSELRLSFVFADDAQCRALAGGRGEAAA
ncbi:MAG TPA: hypothetical protein VNO22_08695 [Planctomycetota bacterium]|nr:hypothetical protein [Planctomycetota bacterium]